MMDGAPSGFVRINASPALSSGFLTLRLAKLASCHPKLDIESAANHRSISLQRHEADIAIRFGKPENGDVLAQPLVIVGTDSMEQMRPVDWCRRSGSGLHRF
ncbi:LysR substrate-binding domain-containing protein [Methylobacterium variabile]|jgi:DNA-binding transcriptional LysR family regulator|uniref:LysR substrate-binding domain-containing protein n=1 Tax=Methylobacterium variabile TaxID=298794 RepID=UPI00069DCA25|nr:LysR substrate-binding domain-containing protein [Methylobacterium variabile]